MAKHSGLHGFLTLVATASLLLAAGGASAASPKEVNAAVDKAVKYLYEVQQGAHWEMSEAPTSDEKHSVRGKQWGGLTAMATYALLAAGENPQDERVEKALKWLLEKDMTGTYAVGLRAQVWQFIPEKHPLRKEVRAAIKRDRELLASGMQERPGEAHGFYGYFPGDDHYDRSNGQYGVLGMWAVEQAGAEVPTKYWQIQDEVWKKSQLQDGGWNYRGDDPSKANMTAAGVATLFITQDYLLDLKRDCQGNFFNQNIEMGMAWMDRHIHELLGGGNYYGMYGVERIGVASGRKYFGTVDWYAVGSDYLVKHQGGDGAWGSENDNSNARKVPDTCFALYFLTRGRAPVLMNKLDYSNVAKEGKEAGWNQRPRDLAIFSKWMSRNLDGRFLNWQIVNLKVQPHELHDAPILYVAGSEALNFSEDDLVKLRTFVEEGGLILGNADCGSAKFARSFASLGAKLFNNEFRDLELTHPILSGQQFNATKWKKRPKVQALGNGVREQMILIPNDDLSKAFQTRSDRVKEELYQLTANIFLYSVREKPVGYKGETYIVRDTGEGKTDRAIKVARVEHVGRWNPEPGGWRRLGNVMKNAGLATVTAEPVKLGQGKLKDHKVAHLTGVTKFKLAEPARKELKAFVEGGGTLIVDAAGGSADFADAAAEELAQLFGDAARKSLTQPLPTTHALYSMPELAVTKFDYRNFARGKVLGKLNTPRLAGLEVGGRVAIVYSRDDVSGALVGQPVDGIFGYASDTATAMMRNMLVYADTAGKGYPPKPKEGEKDKAKAGAPAAPAPAKAATDPKNAEAKNADMKKTDAAPAKAGDAGAKPAAPARGRGAATDKPPARPAAGANRRPQAQ